MAEASLAGSSGASSAEVVAAAVVGAALKAIVVAMSRAGIVVDLMIQSLSGWWGVAIRDGPSFGPRFPAQGRGLRPPVPLSHGAPTQPAFSQVSWLSRP
jgi:hypothetical protein